MKQRLDLPYKKGFRLWSDSLQFKDSEKNSLKRRMDFRDEKDWDFPEKKIETMGRFASIGRENFIEIVVELPRKKRLKLWLDLI